MRGTPGPMSAEVDGCVTCMKCLLVPEMFELDPTVPPVPFRSEVCISLMYFLYLFVKKKIICILSVKLDVQLH